jgi:23S rRNA (uracil1939-C5)-methyltransferase
MKKYLRNIELYGMHSSGRAVGRCGASRVYVDGGLPGETVDLAIDRVQRGYRYGKVVDVVVASPLRTTPFCRHYGICGGCPWQHLRYDGQRHWKREILRNALQKYAVETPEIPPVAPSPLQQGYRNKAEYTFTQAAFATHLPSLGFHVGERRADVCSIDECFLSPPAVHKVAVAIRDAAAMQGLPFYDYPSRSGLLKSLQVRTTTAGALSVLLETTAPEPRVTDFLRTMQGQCPEVGSWFYGSGGDEAPVCAGGAPCLTERSGDMRFRYQPRSFYQPNPLQAENLCALVRTFAGLSGREAVYDLYTGIGTLACHVARDAAVVTGIEGNAAAIADATFNAAANGLTNTRFFVGDILHTFNDGFMARHGVPDVVILDPPRSGTLIEIKKTLLRAAPQKIVYVSCNPVSLAFDLKQLCENYHVAALQPIDMFPHTYHVETVVLLERR